MEKRQDHVVPLQPAHPPFEQHSHLSSCCLNAKRPLLRLKPTSKCTPPKHRNIFPTPHATRFEPDCPSLPSSLLTGVYVPLHSFAKRSPPRLTRRAGRLCRLLRGRCSSPLELHLSSRLVPQASFSRRKKVVHVDGLFAEHKARFKGFRDHLEARWDGIWVRWVEGGGQRPFRAMPVAGGLRQGSALQFGFVGARGCGFLGAFFFAGHCWV
jgi:hypothetical protein